MTTESRTGKSIRNAQVAILYYCIYLVLQFFSRKVFLDHLGTEILGLNTTATNLLQFLNLAELGVGAAIGYLLYKPLAGHNREEVCEIVSVQGYLYRRIAVVVVCAAIVLMCFFPWFFAKTSLSLWYVYATFGVLLCGALAGYFFNYRQIVLTADQKEYKQTIALQSIRILKILLQIVAVIYLPYGYIWWLALELVATVAYVLAINLTLRREYAWLNTDVRKGRLLRQKYPDIFVKTRQIFAHKIAGFVLFQTSPLIAYAYTSLTVVAIYGNYMLIVAGVTSLLTAVFNSVGAGVGNLVAQGNRERIQLIFNELFTSRFLLVISICYGVYILAPAFITLWVGPQYLLDSTTLMLLVGILYINLTRTVVDSYINAYGLYHDIWAPITEALLNLGLSLLFGYFWGLSGILAGVLTSLFVIIFLWKPYFLFRCGMKVPIRKYVQMYSKHMIVAILVTGAIHLLKSYIHIDFTAGWINLILYALIVCGGFFLLAGLLLYATERGMRDFTNRIFDLIKSKL